MICLNACFRLNQMCSLTNNPALYKQMLHVSLQEAFQLLGFDFGGGSSPNPATATASKQVAEKDYVVPEDRAIGRPHMMGWLDLLGDDEELMGTGKGDEGGSEKQQESFEADKWEEVGVEA